MESDLCGYRVFYGNASGSYQCVLDVGNTTDVTIGGFLEGQVYYFAVTAYDYAGNESAFSREVSVAVPLAEEGGVLSAIMDWLFGIIGGADGDQGMSQYSISDFSSASPSDIADSLSIVRLGTWGGAEPAYPSDTGTNEPAGYEIRDVITEVGEQLSLSALYPQGIYYFLPLTGNTEFIENGYIFCQETGVYLYMVTDAAGDLIHLLRVSALDVLTLTGEYISGEGSTIEDENLGITLELSSQAMQGGFPIGIGWSTSELNGSGVVFLDNTHIVEFAIAPFGLVLSEPAEVRVLYDGSEEAVVEYYDEGEKEWIPIENVRVEDGVVVFSTQSLGRFKIYDQPDDIIEARSPSHSSGGCFISTCVP